MKIVHSSFGEMRKNRHNRYFHKRQKNGFWKMQIGAIRKLNFFEYEKKGQATTLSTIEALFIESNESKISRTNKTFRNFIDPETFHSNTNHNHNNNTHTCVCLCMSGKTVDEENKMKTRTQASSQENIHVLAVVFVCCVVYVFVLRLSRFVSVLCSLAAIYSVFYVIISVSAVDSLSIDVY